MGKPPSKPTIPKRSLDALAARLIDVDYELMAQCTGAFFEVVMREIADGNDVFIDQFGKITCVKKPLRGHFVHGRGPGPGAEKRTYWAFKLFIAKTQSFRKRIRESLITPEEEKEHGQVWRG